MLKRTNTSVPVVAFFDKLEVIVKDEASTVLVQAFDMYINQQVQEAANAFIVAGKRRIEENQVVIFSAKWTTFGRIYARMKDQHMLLTICYGDVFDVSKFAVR